MMNYKICLDPIPYKMKLKYIALFGQTAVSQIIRWIIVFDNGAVNRSQNQHLIVARKNLGWSYEKHNSLSLATLRYP